MKLASEPWIYRTRNFTVTCEASEPDFVDPLEYAETVIDAIDRGEAALVTLTAYVYWRHTLLARCRLDRLHVSEPLPEGSKYYHTFEHGIAFDHDHRRAAIRGAIAASGIEAADLDGVPGLRLRKPAVAG
jgi:hypothetical protein